MTFRALILTITLAFNLILATRDAQGTTKPLLEQHVVVLKDGIHPEKLANEYGIKITRSYHHALRGFAAILSTQTLNRLSRDPRVSLIQKDQPVHSLGVQSLNDGSSWGLDRVDQRTPTLNSEYHSTSTGAGVTVYVIDTGVLSDHDEFLTETGSRVISAIDLSNANDFEPYCPDGHGTHVAGIVGGKTYGVAKEVNLVSVRVLDCGGNGTTSTIVAGIDWVTENHHSPAVANLSLGSVGDRVIDLAVQKLIASGVTTVTAAGNSRSDACLSSPGRVPNVINVAASDRDDSRWLWGDYGRCVDLFAPGVDILSAWSYPTPQTFITLSGSSMSAGFVSGAAALYLQRHPEASPIEVRNALLQQSTKGVIGDARSQNAHLLYVLEEDQATKRDVIAPEKVTLISPQEGTTLITNDLIEFKAMAQDDRSIKKVHFYVDGVLRGLAKEAPFVSRIKIEGHKKTRTIWAVAYDSSGNATASSPVKVYIQLK